MKHSLVPAEEEEHPVKRHVRRTETDVEEIQARLAEMQKSYNLLTRSVLLYLSVFVASPLCFSPRSLYGSHTNLELCFFIILLVF